MMRSPWLAGLLAAGLTTGCVERHIVVTSDPPGAYVYRNGMPLGPTPVDDYIIYYGTYQYTLVKDGCETLQAEQPIRPPWYQIPPLDFISENLVPFKIKDERRFPFEMKPLVKDRPDQVLQRAQELRSRGQSIGQPPTPAPPATPGPAVPPPAPPAPPTVTGPGGV
jgi:hypothetical protein